MYNPTVLDTGYTFLYDDDIDVKYSGVGKSDDVIVLYHMGSNGKSKGVSFGDAKKCIGYSLESSFCSSEHHRNSLVMLS